MTCAVCKVNHASILVVRQCGEATKEPVACCPLCVLIDWCKMFNGTADPVVAYGGCLIDGIEFGNNVMASMLRNTVPIHAAPTGKH